MRLGGYVPRKKVQQAYDNPRSKNAAQRIVEMAAESPAKPRGLLGSFARATADVGRRAVSSMQPTSSTEPPAYKPPRTPTPGQRRSQRIDVSGRTPKLSKATQAVSNLLAKGMP